MNLFCFGARAGEGQSLWYQIHDTHTQNTLIIFKIRLGWVGVYIRCCFDVMLLFFVLCNWYIYLLRGIIRCIGDNYFFFWLVSFPVAFWANLINRWLWWNSNIPVLSISNFYTIAHEHWFSGEHIDLLTNEPNTMERLLDDTIYNGNNINWSM